MFALNSTEYYNQNMSIEKSLPENLQGVHIHFVGIKGTGMAALVEILFHNGAIITGSDVSERFYTDEIIEKLGLKALPFSEDNINENIQYVVYSSAYKLDKNPDLIQAVKKGIPCLLYTEALGSYSSRAYSCGICGVHGKTSTTGLTGTILKELPLPSQILAGSIIKSFGDTCTFTTQEFENQKSKSKENNSIFVAETCEYQRHFMSFCPQKIILTSVEPDHQDYYPTYKDIRQAFIEYICKLPHNGQVIFCADDKGAVDTVNLASKLRDDIKMIPYGETAEGDYKLTFGKVEDEKNKFQVQCFNTEFYLAVPGKHEVMDAVAALALCCELLKSYGLNPKNYEKEISNGLSKFAGGKRRSEIIGSFNTKSGNNVVVLDDYGHHPTAVKTTLDGYREFYKGRKIIVDFMSHTYSRTQALLQEFGESFGSADLVILHKIYSSARENAADFEITGKTLYEKVVESKGNEKSVYYSEEILDAKDYLISILEENKDDIYKDGYLFVTMGAGDNWKLGKAILNFYRDKE